MPVQGIIRGDSSSVYHIPIQLNKVKGVVDGGKIEGCEQSCEDKEPITVAVAAEVTTKCTSGTHICSKSDIEHKEQIGYVSCSEYETLRN